MAGMVKRADFLENEVVDLTEEIKLVSPTDTPLTTLLMGRGQVVPANDITVTWREKELNSDKGTLKLEGSEAGEAITSSRKTLSNVCQIIEKVTQVSGTARSLNPKGIGDVFNSEVQDRLVETKRDMEWYFLNGTKALESGSTPRQMNGLVNLVASGNVVETKGALTEEHFLDALQEMWKHGAQGEYFSFVNANIKRMITFGELWLDGDYVGECYKAQAKVEFTKEEIKQCGTFFTDNKVVGCKGTGSLTMHKVNSRMAIKVANMVRNKQDVRFTLISKLADPDAYGAERVSITGVQMDDLTLFDWEAQKPLETEAPFTFTGYEYLDQITPQ